MSIKTLKAKLKKLAEETEKEVIKRTSYWENKSENWQESDKGLYYQEDTEALQEGESLLWEAYDYFPDYFYRDLFGDHSKITVYKSGKIEVEDYDHD